MGQFGSAHPAHNMKLFAAWWFVVLALVAIVAAEPEAEAKAAADPWVYGYGLHHGGVYGVPTYRTYGLGYHHFGKREAEAEPEAAADPWYYNRGYGLHHGITYGVPTYGLGYGYGRIYG